MEYRKLGKTDIDVSVFALGCWPFAGGAYWGDQDDQDSIDTVHAALGAGINFFDATQDSEKEALGRNLKEIPPPYEIYVQTRPEGMVYSYDPFNM